MSRGRVRLRPHARGRQLGIHECHGGGALPGGKGVPFRRAHEQIGQAVQWCLEKHCELQELPLDDLRQLRARVRTQDFYSHLTLDAVLGCHDVDGRHGAGTGAAGAGRGARAAGERYGRSCMRTRNAILPDAEAIHELIADLSGDGTLLPRTLAEICENIRDFTVVRRSRPGDRLRRAASLRHAPGRDALHRRASRTPRARARGAGWSRRCWTKPSGSR